MSALLRIAKARFYADRTYAAILFGARTEGLDDEELHRLREWLPKGRVDQKKADAKALLARLRAWRAASPAPKRVSHPFERTDAWVQASRAMVEGFADGGPAPSALDEAVLEELKLAGGYDAAYRAAAARGAAIDEARRAGIRPDKMAFRGAVEEFCREHGYRDRRDFDRWRTAQRLDDAQLEAFFEDQARVRWARPVTDAAARASLLGHLRAVGVYGRLAEKAETKLARLGELGIATPLSEDVGMTEKEVWQWFFRERQRRDVPEDLARAARESGFRDENDMRSAIIRDLLVDRHERD